MKHLLILAVLALPAFAGDKVGSFEVRPPKTLAPEWSSGDFDPDFTVQPR